MFYQWYTERAFSHFLTAKLGTTYTEVRLEIYIVEALLHSEYNYKQSLE
jgi:hypothetical protein